jgi:3-hydroxybutyryl-CoA dehydrogenase
MKFKIGIVGAGQMGTGISHVCALAGYETMIYDVLEDQLNQSIEITKNNLKRQIKKGIVKADMFDEVINRIKLVNTLDALKDVKIVIEAASEKENIKIDIFKKLDTILPIEAILATNTSSISITKIAASTKRAEKVIGMHFMNPVPVMKLVEVIRGLATDEATFKFVVELAKNIGKEISVSKDYPGFIANRILIPMINEAIFAYYEGIGTIEDIDKTMILGANHPMGPLTLADFIGLDTVLYVLEVLYNNFRDPKFRPCPLLMKMVEAGYLGRKTGKGFYNYTK